MELGARRDVRFVGLEPRSATDQCHRIARSQSHRRWRTATRRVRDPRMHHADQRGRVDRLRAGQHGPQGLGRVRRNLRAPRRRRHHAAGCAEREGGRVRDRRGIRGVRWQRGGPVRHEHHLPVIGHPHQRPVQGMARMEREGRGARGDWRQAHHADRERLGHPGRWRPSGHLRRDRRRRGAGSVRGVPARLRPSDSGDSVSWPASSRVLRACGGGAGGRGQAGVTHRHARRSRLPRHA